MNEFLWAVFGGLGLWLLYRIFQLVKAIHFMILENFNDRDDD